MTDSQSACKHDMSDQSTLILSMSLPHATRGPWSVTCSECHRQFVFEPAVLVSRLQLWWRDPISTSEWFNSVASWGPSNSSPTDSSSSSPAPTPAEADTNGRADSPTRSLSSRVSACTSPSMLLKLASGFKGRRLPGVLIEWTGKARRGDYTVWTPMADLHVLRNRMTLLGGKVRLTRSSDGLGVEASLAALGAAAQEKS